MYKLAQFNSIIHIPSGAVIPMDEGNRDYQAYLDWVDAGNEPDPYVPLPLPIPHSVTPAQGLMALYVLKAITEDDILAAIQSIEDPVMRYQALIAFKKATVWERVSETMGVVAQLLALTDADKDALFTLGATYTNL